MTYFRRAPKFTKMRRSLTRAGAGAFALVFVGLWSVSAMADTVTVFSAASMKPLFDGLAKEFEKQTGHSTSFSYAGSALLARQIELGAPAQIFVSANQQWMDYLAGAGLISDAYRFDLLRNRLALVSSDELTGEQSIAQRLAHLGADDRIAMGMVNSVPAGQYGREALEYLGLWKSVAPLAVQVDNVRAALNLVTLKEVRFGIVYASDAATAPDVFQAGLFPEESHDPIIYTAAAIGTSPTEASLAFLKFLQSDHIRARLGTYGFLPTEG